MKVGRTVKVPDGRTGVIAHIGTDLTNVTVGEEPVYVTHDELKKINSLEDKIPVSKSAKAKKSK